MPQVPSSSNTNELDGDLTFANRARTIFDDCDWSQFLFWSRKSRKRGREPLLLLMSGKPPPMKSARLFNYSVD